MVAFCFGLMMVPISVASSSGSPITMASSLAVSLAMKAS